MRWSERKKGKKSMTEGERKRAFHRLPKDESRRIK